MRDIEKIIKIHDAYKTRCNSAKEHAEIVFNLLKEDPSLINQQNNYNQNILMLSINDGCDILTNAILSDDDILNAIDTSLSDVFNRGALTFSLQRNNTHASRILSKLYMNQNPITVEPYSVRDAFDDIRYAIQNGLALAETKVRKIAWDLGIR